MDGINLSRVVIGGLVAGVVMIAASFLATDFLLAEQGEAMLARLGVETPGGSQIAIFVVASFIIGIALVWLYAAIRPRFGAGLKTAIIAGVTAWFFATLLTSVNFVALGVFSTGEMAAGTVFDLLTWIVAAIAGAWLYREGAPTGA